MHFIEGDQTIHYGIARGHDLRHLQVAETSQLLFDPGLFVKAEQSICEPLKDIRLRTALPPAGVKSEAGGAGDPETSKALRLIPTSESGRVGRENLDLGPPQDLQLVGSEVQPGCRASDTHQIVGQDRLHGSGISRSHSAWCVAAEANKLDAVMLSPKVSRDRLAGLVARLKGCSRTLQNKKLWSASAMAAEREEPGERRPEKPGEVKPMGSANTKGRRVSKVQPKKPGEDRYDWGEQCLIGVLFIVDSEIQWCAIFF
eukprot:Skav207019  [mRNA]  locus=scaffold2740:165896:175282:- [translate_table: standard]